MISQRAETSLVIMPGELCQFAEDQGRDAAARVALMERSILVLFVAGLSWASRRLRTRFPTAICSAALAIVPLAGPPKTKQPRRGYSCDAGTRRLSRLTLNRARLI